MAKRRKRRTIKQQAEKRIANIKNKLRQAEIAGYDVSEEYKSLRVIERTMAGSKREHFTKSDITGLRIISGGLSSRMNKRQIVLPTANVAGTIIGKTALPVTYAEAKGLTRAEVMGLAVNRGLDYFRKQYKATGGKYGSRMSANEYITSLRAIENALGIKIYKGGDLSNYDQLTARQQDKVTSTAFLDYTLDMDAINSLGKTEQKAVSSMLEQLYIQTPYFSEEKYSLYRSHQALHGYDEGSFNEKAEYLMLHSRLTHQLFSKAIYYDSDQYNALRNHLVDAEKANPNQRKIEELRKIVFDSDDMTFDELQDKFDTWLKSVM